MDAERRLRRRRAKQKTIRWRSAPNQPEHDLEMQIVSLYSKGGETAFVDVIKMLPVKACGCEAVTVFVATRSVFWLAQYILNSIATWRQSHQSGDRYAKQATGSCSCCVWPWTASHLSCTRPFNGSIGNRISTVGMQL